MHSKLQETATTIGVLDAPPAGSGRRSVTAYRTGVQSDRRAAARRTSGLTALVGLVVAVTVSAEQPPAPGNHDPLALIVVSATRIPQRSFDLPISIDRVEGRTLRAGQLAVNLSESLVAVPGLSVQSRQNYAQDLQLSVRGFGARSSFGVRGVRLYADGIPGTMPDGQGQFSHFDLESAERIEVLRGPFSALYGNSSGGVLTIFTADGPPGFGMDGTVAAGSLGTQRYALKGGGDTGSINYTVGAAHFETDGYRDHSHAERNNANLKLRFALSERTALTLIGNAVETPYVQDPLGLNASQLATDPRQAGTNALAYDTRKSLTQEQVGATLTSALTDVNDLSLTVYDGRRRTRQFQAILKSSEANPAHPGGVVDLGRDYRGGDVHVTSHTSPGDIPLTLTVGFSYDSLEEARRGYLNYVGAQLGVIGDLRREESNRVAAADQYAQLEWEPSARWRAIAGLRYSDIDLTLRDELAATTGRIRYEAASPVAGLTFRASPTLNVYAAYGRGFETPTLNDIAYRSTDATLSGPNLALVPARSNNYELGIKAGGDRLRVDAAVFYIATRDELAVKANASGRSVFENIGSTERKGAELGMTASWDHGISARLAYTYIRALTTAPYTSCSGLPCPSPTTRIVVPTGSRLPAVPADQLYASFSWQAPRAGFSATVETLGRAQIYADDRDIAAATGYWSTNLRAGFTQVLSGWTFSETARIDNVADRRYVGSVIVNESNKRYFEPAPGRTAFLLFTAAYR